MQWWVQCSELVRRLGMVVAGTYGLYLAWLRLTANNRQTEALTRQAETAIAQAGLNCREHVAERVNRAFRQLAEPKLEARPGAVYALRGIVHDLPECAHAAVVLPSAYLRVPPPMCARS